MNVTKLTNSAILQGDGCLRRGRIVDHLRQVVADVLEINPEFVQDELGFNTAPNWDSLNHINLMLSLEEAFGLTISDDELVTLTSVRAIREFLERSGSLA